MGKYYAVKNGRKVGVFKNWKECEEQVKGYPGAKYKSFLTEEEAKQYIGEIHKKVKKPVLHDINKIVTKQPIKQIVKSKEKKVLTDDQKRAFDYMMLGENVFLTGEAGTGKSFVVNAFIEEMEAHNKNVLVCAPTGIAALQINGVTIHRSFQAPIEPNINKRISKVPEVVKNADVIIIDEISMCRRDLFDYVTRVIAKAEEICLKRKQLIVVGDFFQLPPVTTKEDYKVLSEIYPDYDKGFAFESTNWKDFGFHMIALKQVMRQSDSQFIRELNKIRIGDNKAIDYFNQNASKERIKDGIVICATNAVADRINHEELSKIKHKSKIFKAKIKGDVRANDKPTADEVKLKVGARVIVLINDTEMFTYQNGSLGEVVGIEDQSVDVLLDRNQSIVRFSPYEWNVENYTLTQENIDGVNYQKLKKKKVGSFTQIPLKLAYAITMHKSQGQTYDKVNLIPYSFDCGQLYVAISRVKSIEGLCLIQRMRQEDLVCNERVKEFYQIGNSEKQRDLFIDFAKEVMNMDEHIQEQYPKELKALIENLKRELSSY